MGWPLGGNWDRATTPPGASKADLAMMLAAFCLAVNERQALCGKTERAFVYNYAGDSKTRPTAADFSGSAIFPYNVSAVYEDVKGYGISFYLVSSMLGRFDFNMTWYKDAACTIWYPDADIKSDVDTEIGASFNLKAGPMYLKNWLWLKALYNKLIYTTISGTPTDLRPSLTDQT